MMALATTQSLPRRPKSSHERILIREHADFILGAVATTNPSVDNFEKPATTSSLVNNSRSSGVNDADYTNKNSAVSGGQSRVQIQQEQQATAVEDVNKDVTSNLDLTSSILIM
jgi:hypothetical protein